MCPTISKPDSINEKCLDTILGTILSNNRLNNQSQTVIPLGVAGSGKTWTCQVMLRRLLNMFGYAQETDMVKHLTAAREVIQPMVTASVHGSGSSSRMVSTSRQ